jgi:hypothetical protein
MSKKRKSFFAKEFRAHFPVNFTPMFYFLHILYGIEIEEEN